MHAFRCLLGLSASIIITLAQNVPAASTTTRASEDRTGTSTAIVIADPTPYILHNTGTDIYGKTTAEMTRSSPPCSTTASSSTATLPCATVTFGRKVASSASGSPSSAATSTFTGAAIPLRAPQPFQGIAKLLGRKRASQKPVERLIVSGAVSGIGNLVAPVSNIVPQLGEATLSAGNAEPNPERQYAMGLESGNYDALASQSKAAVGTGSGLVSMWASYTLEGNQYATYYANNGHGNPKQALLNELALANGAGGNIVATVTNAGVPAVATLVGTLKDDAGPDLLAIMGQVDKTTYAIAPPTATSTSTRSMGSMTASSTPHSSTVRPARTTTATETHTAAVSSVAKSSSTGSAKTS